MKYDNYKYNKQQQISMLKGEGEEQKSFQYDKNGEDE